MLQPSYKNLKNYPSITGRNFAIPAFIKSGGAMFGTIVTRIDNVKITQNSSINPAEKITKDVEFSGIEALNLLTSGKIELNLQKITDLINGDGTADLTSQLGTFAATTSSANSGVINDGEFKINKGVNLNSPLVEARSAFVNLSEFIGSQYVLNALGTSQEAFFDEIRDLDNNSQRIIGGAQDRNIRMLGDAFVETQLLTTQLASLRKDALYLRDSRCIGGQVRFINHKSPRIIFP